MWSGRKVVDSQKVILKNAIPQLKPKNLKRLFKTREKFIFFPVTLLTTGYILYHTYNDIPYISIAGLFSYFYFKGAVIGTKETYISYRQNLRIKKLCKKYKNLITRFDNKIAVVEETENKITIFSNELTNKELVSKTQKFELFFNRNIAYIIRKKGNFKYNDIIFFTETNFKKYYKFEEYINYVNKKKMEKMILPLILGIDQKNEILIADLAKIKYLFIAGEAGGGKSVSVNTCIQSLMIFSPDVVYILIDLKEAIEVADYDDFPNCIICSNREQLSKILIILEKMMMDRLQLIRKTKNCKNIDAYNAKPGIKKMNYIVFVIDEMARLKLCSENNKSGKSDDEIRLITILQLGRAAGIFGIGATQRPSTEQIDGDLRAGFQKSISFCVSRPETQKMTKIMGTETLKKGEFKTDIFNNTGTVYKGFLILDEEDKTSSLPWCNQVYEDLYSVLVEGKTIEEEKKEEIFVKTKETRLDKYKRFLQRMLQKHNKSYDQELRPQLSYAQIIKPILNSVIKDVESIKKLSGMKKISKESNILIHGDNYEKFLQFIFVNFNEKNGQVPGIKETSEKTGIKEKQRRKFLTTACEEGFIKKKTKTSYEIILDFHGWDRFKDEK
jgi:hypothetical protein